MRGVRIPYVRQPTAVLRPKVDWILNPHGWGSYHENVGKHRDYTQQNTPSVSATIIETEHGVGLSLPGTGGQSQRYDHPYFHRASGGDLYDALTMGGWFKCSNTADDNTVIAQFAGVTTPENSAWQMDIDTHAGTDLRPKLHAHADDHVILQSTTDAAAVGVITNINDGEYHHVIGQIYLDGSNLLNLVLYVNGKLEDHVVHTSTGWNRDSANTTTNLLEVFERGGGDPEPYNGQVVGLFLDRTRWDDARIARAYRDHWSELFEPVALVRGPSGPVITDVAGDEQWQDGDTGLVATGTGFVV